jgi:hypothetical protein
MMKPGKPDQHFCFMDFEASSLSRESYPIEVAWTDDSGTINSYLVNPDAVVSWRDWDPVSEEIHGIPRQLLCEQGHAPEWVCQQLNASIGLITIYTDAPAYDEFWCRRLYEATQIPFPQWKFENIDDLLYDMFYAVKGDEPGAIQNQGFLLWIDQLKKEARRRAPGEHRAAWDVEYLVQLFQLAGQG